MFKYFMLALLLVPGVSNSASFNCNVKLTPVEKSICSNPVLSGLDDELGALYKYRSMIPGEKAIQRDWLKKRNNCLDDSCIERAYREQIELFTASQIPIKECISTAKELSAYAAVHTDETLKEDKRVDLNGDGEDEIIYSEMCNVHCPYTVYEKIKGCYFQIASFTAREYFVVPAQGSEIDEFLSKDEQAKYKKNNNIGKDSFNCLLINDVEQYGDLTVGPSYQPWCFSKKL